MKYLLALLAFAIATTALGGDSEIAEQQKVAMARATEFRTFTTTDGEEFLGRLVRFTPAISSVELEMPDGSKRTAHLQTLSEEDQTFIQDWNTGASLFADNKIRLTIRKKTDPDKKSTGSRSGWHSMFPNMKYTDNWYPEKGENSYDEIFYELCLENKSEYLVDGLIIEYCIYHQTTIKEEYMVTILKEAYDGGRAYWVGYPNQGGKHPEKTVSNVIIGTLCVQQITKHKKVKLVTKPLKLVGKAEEMARYHPDPPHKAGDRGTRNTRIIRGKLLGIRCRVYIPTRAENYAMIERATPKSLLLKTEWIAPE